METVIRCIAVDDEMPALKIIEQFVNFFMKRNSLTVTVGVILLIIFLLLLFTFQVRQTELAVVTTFAKSAHPISQPGLYFKWPPPIQKVYKFDNRIHNLEDEFAEALTGNGHPILINVFAGWTIENSEKYFTYFPAGSTSTAESALKSLVASAKAAVIGQYLFSDFISTDPKQLKFVEIENKILQNVQASAQDKYGIKVAFLGIKRIGLPEAVTQKVFDRMKAERQREADRLQAQGDAEAMTIRSAADRDRNAIISKADSEAQAIIGQADAEAQKYFAAFDEKPDLAIFLLKMKTLALALQDRTTLVLDERTSPFDMLIDSQKEAPKAPPAKPTPPAGDGLTQNAPGAK